MLRPILGCFCALLLLGCATTDNPRQGGLFGYNPSAYERRVAERRQIAEELARNNQERQRDAQQLQQEKIAKRGVIEDQQKILNALDIEMARLDTDLNHLEQNINTYKERTKAQKAKKQQIMDETAKLKKQIDALKKLTQIGEVEKKEKMTKLRQDIETQLKIVETFTSSNK